jgi:hypothetical protein
MDISTMGSAFLSDPEPYQNETEADDLKSGILELPAKLLKGLYWER